MCTIPGKQIIYFIFNTRCQMRTVGFCTFREGLLPEEFCLIALGFMLSRYRFYFSALACRMDLSFFDLFAFGVRFIK
jgi:hypothetical protein